MWTQDAANKTVEQMADHSNQIDRIYPMSHFRAEVARVMSLETGLSDSDLQIILKFLACDRSAIVYDSQVDKFHLLDAQMLIDRYQTVKFKGRDETSASLTDQDGTIASLKSLIADLEEQIALLSGRISTLSTTAQSAVKDKNRVSALAALRAKKLNETALAQRSETLAQLQEVYSRIEQAVDQVAIVRVMKDSTSVLRSLHAEVGSISKVEEVVADLRDEMEKVDQIGSVIEIGNQAQNNIDEGAVDEELESLEKQAKSEQEEKEAQHTIEKLNSIDKALRLEEYQDLEPETMPRSAEEIPTRPQEPRIDEGINAMKHLSLDPDQVLPG